MAGITWDNFERYRQKGLDARRAGQWDSARIYLLEAARGELFTSGQQRGLSYGCLRLVLKHVWLHPARLRFAFAMARLFRDSGLAPRRCRRTGP